MMTSVNIHKVPSEDDGEQLLDLRKYLQESLTLERGDDVGYHSSDKTYIEIDPNLQEANAHFEQGKYGEAATKCNDCIFIAKAKGEPDIEKKAECMMHLARCKECYIIKEINDKKMTLSHNKTAIEIAEKLEDKRLLLKVYYETAWMYFYLGNYSTLLPYLEKALQVAKDLGDANAEIETYIHMAANYRLANDHIKEIEKLNEASHVIKMRGYRNKRFMVAIHLNRAQAYRSLDQEEEAEAALKDYFAELVALKEIEDKVSTHFIDVIVSFLQDRGHKWFSNHCFGFEFLLSMCHVCIIMSWYNTYLAHEFWVKFVAQTIDHGGITMNLNELSADQFCMIGNMLKLAIKYALQRYLKVDENHPDAGIILGTNTDVMNLTDRKSLIGFVKKLIDVAWKGIMEEEDIVFHATKAERRALLLSSWGVTLYLFRQNIQAHKFLTESVDRFESVFVVEKDENYRMTIIDRFIDTYKMLFKLLLDEERYVEALLVADRCHAKALKSCLSTKLQASEKIDEKDINSLVSDGKYAILFYTWCFNDLCIFLIQRTKKDKNQNIDKISLKFHIQREAKPKIDQEVEYVLGQMDMQSSRDLNTDKDISDKHTSLCLRCESTRSQTPCENDDDSHPVESSSIENRGLNIRLKKLYDLLLSPIRNELTVDKVVIIPEGKSLYSVPFAALQDPTTKQFFSQDKELRFSPSITNLELHRQVPDDYYNTCGSLIVGDPALVTCKPLPGSRDEALKIVNIIEGVTPLIGADATKSAVVKKMPKACIIHFAGHMKVQDEISAILLAPEIYAENQVYDGLTSEEISKEEVRAQLVVLSGCNSGRGKTSAEGVVGLARAFLAAGAGAVLVSLWKINDKKTCEFMTIFYRYLLDWDQARSANESLKLTINDMREKYPFRPEFWSGFFLIGDDVTINRQAISTQRE